MKPREQVDAAVDAVVIGRRLDVAEGICRARERRYGQRLEGVRRRQIGGQLTGERKRHLAEYLGL